MRQSSRPTEPSGLRTLGPRRRRRTTLVGLLAAALTLGSLAATTSGSSAGAPAAAPVAASAAAPAAARQNAATTFRVATFNALGHSHTRPGGDRPGWEQGPKRMRMATQVIESEGVDLVGFQEFEPPQYKAFTDLMSKTWSIAPGLDAPGTAQSKAIAWRTADWTLVSQTTFQSPYFHGEMQARPLIQLRHNVTGQLIWVMNTHNAADVRGNAQAHRDKAERIQARLVNSLRQANPDIPVILLGDMNDRERFYCPMTYLTELESASGGTHVDKPGGACAPAKPVLIDWVMGTSDIFWSGYRIQGQGLEKSSDHDLVSAVASIPPSAAAKAGVKRVVVIDVEGLRSNVVTKRKTPTLARIRSKGASTLRARTAEERVTSLPNTVSIATGRAIRKKYRGHGVAATPRSSATIRSLAGRYVPSMFDVVHDYGLSTAFYSGDAKSALIPRSYNSRNGAVDRNGKNNGRRKVGRSLVTDRDGKVVQAARKQLAKSAPALTFVQLDDPARAAEKYGPRSKQYLAALRVTDARVNRLMKTIGTQASTKSSTTVIITASGTGPSTMPTNVVPLLVKGPGVIKSDLYKLNPRYSASAPRRYTGTQPIRTGAIANLVTSLLRLPVVPGSRFNTKQDLDVFDPALTSGSPVPGS